MRAPTQVDVRWAAPAGSSWAVLVAVLPRPDLHVTVSVLLLLVGAAALLVAVGAGRRARREWSSASASPSPSASGRQRASGSPGSRVVPAAALVALVALVAGLVLAGAAARQHVRYPEELVALSGHSAELHGTATGRVAAGTRAVQVTVREVVVADEVVWRGRASFLLLGPRVAEGAAIEVGQEVSARVSVLPVEPGDDVAFVAAVRGQVVPGAPPSGAAGLADSVRSDFRGVTAELPGDGGSLLPGLAVGDTSAVDDELDEAMKASSLSHLTAVSGSNCAVLVALVMLVGGALGVPRLARLLLAAVLLLAFLVLVTPEPSIVRASVMALVVLVHLAAGRPVSGLPVVSLAVSGLLLGDPWLARDLGFALSVLATAGLVVLAAPLADAFARFLPRPVAAVLAVPVAAQLACQPVLLLLDPRVAVHGVVANVLAEPAAPLATVGGLVVCATASWAPGPAELVARAAWVPATWIGAVARSVASWPLARVEWPGGPTGVVLLAALTVLVAGAVLARPGGRLRRVVVVLLTGALAVGAGAVVGVRTGERSAVPADWTIAQCDVGQGDAVLVRSDGQVALVDVGDDEAALGGCLRRFGVDRIDLLVLTHFDADHVGAVDVVTGRVGRALVGPTASPDDERVVDDLAGGGAEVVEVAVGVGGVLGELGWSVLWPVRADAAGNDASVVTLWRPLPGCRTGCLSLLDLGDLAEAPQRLLLSSSGGALSGVDVVKVSHHGSADQHAGLYAAARASVGLVGVGADNSYGHPRREALDMVEEAGAEVTRTDLDGDAAVVVDDSGGVRLWRRHAVAGHAPSADPSAAGAAGSWAPAASGEAVTLGAGRPRRPRPRRTVAARTTGKTTKKASVAVDQVPWHAIRPAPVVLVSGPEQFLAERAVRQLRDQLVAEDSSLEVHDLEADHYQPGELITLASPSLFAEPRLLRVVSVEKCTDAFLTETLRYLESPADDTYLVLRHGGGVRGKKLLDTIRAGVGGGVEVVCAELKKDTEKHDFAAGEFRSARRRVSSGALRALVTAFSDDLAELASACQQLISDAADEITEATVEKYYAGRVETNAFKVADAAIAGRQGEALVLLRHALSSGADPVPVVAAFAMKIRTMAKVQGVYGPSGQLASRLGMAPWQVERAQRDVRGWSEDGLGRCIELLAETDAAVKGAQRDAIYALERMVTTVATRGAVGR
ncbi:DNA polymerase III delta subunit [Frigoribacterium sp. PhB107]|nr:DNA polymerase III delta subunit [Frigoribacterium sp. PhB107]